MADLSVVVYGKNRPRGQIQPPTAATLVVVVSETLRVISNTVSAIRGLTGLVAFFASLDQATITNYTARVWNAAGDTIEDTQDLGVPTPDGNNVIIVDLSATFAGLAAGVYMVSILASDAGGSTDSAKSASFSLPLP